MSDAPPPLEAAASEGGPTEKSAAAWAVEGDAGVPNVEEEAMTTDQKKGEKRLRWWLNAYG